jgi:hypothetical protein
VLSVSVNPIQCYHEETSRTTGRDGEVVSVKGTPGFFEIGGVVFFVIPCATALGAVAGWVLWSLMFRLHPADPSVVRHNLLPDPALRLIVIVILLSGVILAAFISWTALRTVLPIKTVLNGSADEIVCWKQVWGLTLLKRRIARPCTLVTRVGRMSGGRWMYWVSLRGNSFSKIQVIWPGVHSSRSGALIAVKQIVDIIQSQLGPLDVDERVAPGAKHRRGTRGGRRDETDAT